MPLQIRRGTTAEIGNIVPLEGEILYDRTTKKLIVGDGITTGGILAAGLGTDEVKDTAAESITNGTHSGITFTYNSVTKTINATVPVFDADDAKDAAAQAFTTGTHQGISFSYDSINKTINAQVNFLEVFETIETEAIKTNKIYNNSSSVVIDVETGGFFGDLEGTVTGSVTGDLKGSVFADDSSLLVNAVDRTINGNIITGSITASSVNISVGSPIFLNDTAYVDSNSYFSPGQLQVRGFHSDDEPSTFILKKARGTSSVPTTVQNNDKIGAIGFNGFDGTIYQGSALIQAKITGSVSPGITPSTLSFFTTNSSGVLTESLTITNDGGVVAYTSSKALSPFRLQSAINDNEGSNYILLDRNRGTRDVPTTLQAEDTIWGVGYRGYDGTKFVVSGIVSTAVDGPINTGQFYSIPGRIEFRNVNAAGDLDIRMVLSAEGILKVRALGGIEVDDTYDQNWIRFDVMPRLPEFENESEANSSIDGLDPVGTSPNEMNGMMYYDKALGKIRARAGGVWVDLH